MNNFLKLINLSKKYEKNKSVKVLNNINFKFEAGNVYSIMGPSGSGKSTLLNLLSLIDIPSSGYIEFNKKKIDPNSSIENDFVRSKNIGIIYQDKNLLPDFTALENVLPNIILADEPTGNLDFENAKQIFKIIFNLKEKNRIIIFATHNRYFANMADCKIKMIGGKMNVTNERIS